MHTYAEKKKKQPMKTSPQRKARPCIFIDKKMENAKQTPLSLASLSSFMMLLTLLGISAVNIIIIAIYFT